MSSRKKKSALARIVDAITEVMGQPYPEESIVVPATKKKRAPAKRRAPAKKKRKAASRKSKKR